MLKILEKMLEDRSWAVAGADGPGRRWVCSCGASLEWDRSWSWYAQ